MIPAFIADRENKKRRGELDHENRVGASVGTAVHMYDVFDDDDDDDEVVLESKGSSPAPQASPMEEAQAQIALEQEKARIQQQQEAAARQREEEAKQQRIAKARGLQQSAYNNALGYFDTQAGARGFDQGLLNKYGAENLYDSSIDNARMGIAEDDLNPGASYNTSTAFNNALETALGGYRSDLTQQLNGIAGEGYGYSQFGDTSDDSILQAILGQRKTDAMSQLDAAKARGQLNDTGYSRALDYLGDQSKAAMSDLQSIGGGVLSGYRSDLDKFRAGELDQIGSADFSNPFDFSGFQTQLGDKTNNFRNNMQGDIYNAIGDQSFFDPASIISKSGAIQGYYNPTTTQQGQNATTAANPLLNAFTNDEKKKQQQTGTGSVNGVF